MPNEATRRFAMRAFCRCPEKTWLALGLLREGRVEEGLRVLDELAEDDDVRSTGARSTSSG